MMIYRQIDYTVDRPFETGIDSGRQNDPIF